MTISPELLAAYADGELDAETAGLVEAQIAADPDLKANLAAHHALRAKLATHFSAVTALPVPDRLRQAVMADGKSPDVIDFAAEAEKRRARPKVMRWGHIVGPALAASLVLALLGYSQRSADGYAQGDLAEALDEQLVATQVADAPVRILLSVRNEQGQYCRGFSGKARSGLACHDDRGWRFVRTFGGTNQASAEYRQAGSADMAIMAAIQELAAGPALDAAGEAQAAGDGWRGR